MYTLKSKVFFFGREAYVADRPRIFGLYESLQDAWMAMEALEEQSGGIDIEATLHEVRNVLDLPDWLRSSPVLNDLVVPPPSD